MEDAEWQASELKVDDVPKLRELIKNHGTTANTLLDALASSDAELGAELSRFLPRKRRLRKASDTERVVKTTKTAAAQTQKLREELGKVRTDLTEINANLDRAESTVSGLRTELNILTEKGWDVSAFEQRTTVFEGAVATARAKWTETYITEPTEIAKSTTDEAWKLKAEVGALEPRRTAADEAYGTQPGRVSTAEATTETVRGRFARLQDTYNEVCLVGFEDLQTELTKALGALRVAHETAGGLTGKQGLSLEAVKRSEELNESFDKTLESIRAMEERLQERENHLATLALELPREVSKVSALFASAMNLASHPDVEDLTGAEIQSLAESVANLSAGMSTAEGQKPDYLNIEKRQIKLAEEVERVHAAATEQKQEMDDLRTDIPQLADGYNGLLTAVKDFANRPKVRLDEETKLQISSLQAYKHELASDRKNLRKQHRRLKKLLKGTHELMEQAQAEAGEDSTLLKAAKIAGGTALALAGIIMLDD